MNEEELRELIIEQSALSDWYALLCYLLQTPSAEMLDQLATVSMGDDVRAIASEAGVGLQEVAAVAASFDELHGELAAGSLGLSDLRQEHTRLFRHPKHPRVQYYESLFLDEERVAAGKSSSEPCLFVNPVAMNAVEFYKKGGFATPNHDFPPDYVATELEFASKNHHRVAELANEALMAASRGEPVDAESLEAAIERLRAFKDAHVLNWMPRFFEKLSAEANGIFYPQVGILGGVLMSIEGK